MRVLPAPLLLALLLPPSPGGGQAILNVERLQGEEEEGIHGDLSVSLQAAAGNTDLLLVGGELGLGRLSQHHWIRAYAGGERVEEEGKDILDNRYLHLRYNFRFSQRLRTFHFYQLQTNQNLLLDRRRLWGSGIRYRLLGGSSGCLDAGSGLMLEAEELNEERLGPGEDSDYETVRFANLLVGSGSLGEGRRWVSVVYYQPNAERFGDYRLSAEVGLAVELVDSLHLDFTLRWRHDSRAPGDLDDDDVAVKTGFTYSLR